ncbi:translesion DNA synthesis-associated protein ImuA [Aquabacterium sp. A7-Y]|uniref:translesion DNA synthesis-associated protein ImuA n=1 Tax=Aquabacterium sp. A7-Y TaxID=1349605 RepID=UPI00223E0E28|nr:translesion DNA synthesis-associated protein ImuA [Aquabacterium sp. A7-Y]MCW7537405.1 translesion DNA synthesis-associated protein ImuA [Aquabacterium sp. A7-Y]
MSASTSGQDPTFLSPTVPDAAAPEPARLSLDVLQRRLGPVMWRGDQLAEGSEPALPTGHAMLDAELPGGGWPSRSLTEVLLPPGAACEWRLLGPGLPRLCEGGRTLVLVGASAPVETALQPHLPALQAAGLACGRLLWVSGVSGPQALWAVEQALHCRDAGAVLAWLPQVRPEALRRLQTQAQSAGTPLFVFRPGAEPPQASAAPLRLHVAPGRAWSLRVRLLKRRGPPCHETLELPALPPGLAPAMAVKLRASLLNERAGVAAASGAMARSPSEELADALLARAAVPRVVVPA